MHEPELLILDEPTIGLDPQQIRQVRELIRGLADRHTILLSSHILPEVEMTCHRVMILNQGRLLASDSTANLRQLLARRTRVAAELRAPEAELREELALLLPGGAFELRAEDGWWTVTFEYDGEADPRIALFAAAVRRGWTVRELRREQHSLEDIFVALTTANPEAGA